MAAPCDFVGSWKLEEIFDKNNARNANFEVPEGNFIMTISQEEKSNSGTLNYTMVIRNSLCGTITFGDDGSVEIVEKLSPGGVLFPPKALYGLEVCLGNNLPEMTSISKPTDTSLELRGGGSKIKFSLEHLKKVV